MTLKIEEGDDIAGDIMERHVRGAIQFNGDDGVATSFAKKGELLIAFLDNLAFFLFENGDCFIIGFIFFSFIAKFF